MRKLGLVSLVIASAAAANPNVPAPPQAAPMLLTNATIHTVSGPTIARGKLLVSEGRIAAIGGPEADIAVPERVIDLGGLDVYPGLISANTALGLVEIQAVRATLDVTEPGPVNANARADVAVNPDSELLPVTRANGVLIALSVPQAGNRSLIVGRSAAIQLDGWTSEQMTVKTPVGLHVVWPEMRIPDGLPAQRREQLIERRDEQLQTLRRSFEDARAYATAVAAAEASGDRPPPRDRGTGTAIPETVETDLRWEAMLPVFSGDLPVFAHVDELDQIRHALALADEFGFRLVIVGGMDAWRIADVLAERQVPVIFSGVHRLPMRRWEPYSTAFEAPAKLLAAGVTVAIAGPGGTFDAPHSRNLPYEAATAVAHGLDHDEALKAVTLYPARILGLDDRLGSLDVGKDATFIVTDGDPLEISTQVRRAFIAGRELDLTTRHTTLYEKYSERLRQLGFTE